MTRHVNEIQNNAKISKHHEAISMCFNQGTMWILNHKKFKRKSLEIIRKILEIGNCWPILYGMFMEKICLKAPGSYSGPFGTYNSSICLWENLKTLISMISGLLDVSLSPKTNIINLWRHHDTSNNPRKIPTHLKTYYFGKFDIWKL